ncbi:DUF72 domain-containing protein [Marivirga sp. S37H4]|uniref:DUF72 domain-containing protein n=1 Tax=Marivirga aurantiaca TaxID=2802615 RepID=A0A934X067_9BACT|nr:DUF72 domain-containing protein [Marivirga aurantiaca]MBK6266459.1 DUF72 domain-containing protein [Marivirga aurantiaca]
MQTYIGCSGFHYNDWRGKFYPENLPRKEWLAYYAHHFNSVEINTTFYGLPKEATLKNWYDQVSGNFKFTLKGSRFITHIKKMTKPEESLSNFYYSIETLGGKLGCILWQLPGYIHKDMEKLGKFCQALSTDYNNVIEFRHNSWFDEEVYEVLKKYNVSFCMLSAPDDLRNDRVNTTNKAYLRFHGTEQWYSGLYSEEELKNWAKSLQEMKDLQSSYIYFNNDQKARAPENARMMQELMKG